MRHKTKAAGGYTVIVETVVNDGWHRVRREIVAPAERQGLADDELLIGPFPTESEAAIAGLEHCESWIANELRTPIEDDEGSPPVSV